jgi:hypothetical protein
MVVEEQFDARIGRIGGVKPLEEADEFARPIAILDTGMHLAGQQIDPGQQAQRAMTFVFMIACKKVFRETASGAKTDRAELRKMLAKLEDGDVLMVTRLDRLARSTRDLLNILATITDR